MEAGLNLFSIRTLIGSEKDYLETSVKLRDMGYSYVQFSGAPYDCEMIKRVSDKSGLAVRLTHVPLDRIVGDTERLMREHELFGCHSIGLGMMPTDCVDDFDKLRTLTESLQKSAAAMKRAGFTLNYHNHHMEFYKYDGEHTVFEYLIENAPDMHFTYDTYWVHFGGKDELSYIDNIRGRAECIHLKDYRIEKSDDGPCGYAPVFAPVGSGNLDFAAIVKAAKSAGAEYFFVEQDNAVDYPDPLEPVAQSIRYIREKL